MEADRIWSLQKATQRAMEPREEHSVKNESSAPSAELVDATLPQLIDSGSVITNENQDDTRAISGQVQSGAQNRTVASSAPKTPTDLRGQIVSGKYSIEEKLGEGGMGSVYQAYDGLMKRVVAIKLLNQDREISQESWQRFQQEATATSTLNHSNIVRVHDFNVCDIHGPYLVMDLIDGEPLNCLISRKGRLDAQFVADIVIQIADGLQHAHEKGIVHRDLKPSNILVLSEPGKPPAAQVVDFGIAKLQGHNLEDLKLTKTGEVFGSPLYMSPEQCLANKLDQRSDIYSLGCVMYEALCGEPPFKGRNFGETVIKHTRETPKAFAADLQIPSALKRIVFCALEKSPEDRYQSMAALRKELMSFKRGQFVRVKQKKRMWIIAALACLATVPITVFFSLRDSVKENPEFISALFMKYHVPQIVEWFVLPDDETRTALNAVKIALQDYKQHRFTQAEAVLKGVIDANPSLKANRRLTAWPLARALARQEKPEKLKEAEDVIKKTYETDFKIGMNLRIVGITLKLHDGCNPPSGFFFQRSIDYFDKAKDPEQAAKSRYLLATYQLDANQLPEAKKNFHAALSVLEQSKSKKAEEWITNCHKGLKKLEAAEAKAKARN